MLLTVRSGKVSCFGSVLLLGFTVALLSAVLLGLGQKPFGIRTVFSTLLTASLVLLVLSHFRIAAVTASGRLVVRSLFGRDSVDSRSCALGVSVQAGSKGSTYVVYATDGTARAELAECWSQKSAARAARRLEACFAIDRSDAQRRPAQTQVDAERQRTEASYAAARAQVDAYYQSGAFRRAGYWMLAGLLIYLVVIWLFTWLTGSRL